MSKNLILEEFELEDYPISIHIPVSSPVNAIWKTPTGFEKAIDAATVPGLKLAEIVALDGTFVALEDGRIRRFPVIGTTSGGDIILREQVGTTGHAGRYIEVDPSIVRPAQNS